MARRILSPTAQDPPPNIDPRVGRPKSGVRWPEYGIAFRYRPIWFALPRSQPPARGTPSEHTPRSHAAESDKRKQGADGTEAKAGPGKPQRRLRYVQFKTNGLHTSAVCIVPRVSSRPFECWCSSNRHVPCVNKTSNHKAEAGAHRVDSIRSGALARCSGRKTRPRSAGSQHPSACCSPTDCRWAHIATGAGPSPRSRPPAWDCGTLSSVERRSGAVAEAGEELSTFGIGRTPQR